MDSTRPNGAAQGPKYSIIPARALDDPRLKPADIVVLALLCTYANSKSNICWVSDDTLAKRRGVDVSVIRKSMARLKRYGYIERQKRKQNTALTTILFDAKTSHHVPCS